MCLIALAYRQHDNYPLLVAANRDEYYHRPTAAAEFWSDHPGLLAGRDLQAGGTWLGVTHGGRFAAITNHRNPPTTPAVPRSRGLLTLDFLTGSMTAQAYLQELAAEAHSYAGFNLLLADQLGLFYYSNIEQEIRALQPGIYGLSNAFLDTPWPKLTRAQQQLDALMQVPAVSHAQLQATVARREVEPDAALPDTGVGLELERLLSAQFICSEQYGTRATTSLSLDRHGEICFREDSFRQQGQAADQRQYSFNPAGRE